MGKTPKSNTAAKAKGRSTPKPKVDAESSPQTAPAMYYRLHTFLETIRVIKGYEDPLCTLLHAIQTNGGTSPETENELLDLLEEMPGAVYTLERNSVLDLLDPRNIEAKLPVLPPPAATPRRGKAKAS